MRKSYKVYILWLVLFIPFPAWSIYLNVRIFSNIETKEISFTSVKSIYNIYDRDSLICKIPIDSIIKFSIDNNKIKISSNSIDFGSYLSVSIIGESLENIFKINLDSVLLSERFYNDNVKLSVAEGNIRIINNVELERYVAGVVKSEVYGSSNNIDFFEIQAVITRTYALNNIMKHYKEGFNLCDGVHCQVYHGRCTIDKILQATEKCKGKVIIDKDSEMISAAFHSNSGGQTVNSEDVWTIPTSYLKSTIDTFSINKRNSTWQVELSVNEWLEYLSQRHNYPVYDSLKALTALNFQQNQRKVYFYENIPLKLIRRDFNLKSTFFSITTIDNIVYLDGKGYGHGVGLSQEGAAYMVELGYSSIDIIKFYYKDVSIVDCKNLGIIDWKNQ